MLGDFPIDVVLLAADLEASKDFYADKIGLEIVNDTPYAVQFKCGGGSQLGVSKSSVGTADPQTQAAFRVKDLAAEFAAVRRRAVTTEVAGFAHLKAVAAV